MRQFAALGVRLGVPPKPPVIDEELADLSTFSRRPGGIHLEALAVAPPLVEWTPLTAPVPGRLVAGGLPGDSGARFTLKIPKDWNGGLVAAAAPGLSPCEAYDLIWGDFLLARGWAFAVTDKATRMVRADDAVYLPLDPDGHPSRWLGRLENLARHARGELVYRTGRAPSRTFAVGVSNGGYLVRRALEERPDLFDGGVEVSGALWRSEGPSFLTQLPAALRSAELGFTAESLKAAGLALPDGWGGLATFYRDFLWGPTLAYFLAHLDPEWRGEPSRYDYAARPATVRRAVQALECTGKLGKPLYSIAGEADLLTPPGTHLDPYIDLVKGAGRAALHRVVRVPGGSHNDADRHLEPTAVALTPYAHKAFLEQTTSVQATSLSAQ